jgi:intein-encoded DNA endonuclease-like protein
MLRDEKWRVKITTSNTDDTYYVTQDGLDQIRDTLDDGEFVKFEDTDGEVYVIRKSLIERVHIRKEEE